MEIADFLTPEHVIAKLRAGSKKQALQELSRRAVEIVGLPEQVIFTTLMKRERLGTTGLGNGAAIPHGRFSTIDRMYGMFARLEHPVEYEAIDERPVDLLFLLLAPESSGADHLKALSRVARLFRDKIVCEKLRGTDDAEALYALLVDTTASWAAA
jgi:PTS system nitrogen regulatory IIA component